MSRGKEVKKLREKMGMNRREFSDYYGIPYRTTLFNVAMLVRHDEDGKYYLYDIMKIKKETSNLFQSNDFTQ